MEESPENSIENKKKPARSMCLRRKYIIAACIILLCVIIGLIYSAMTWTPVDSEAKKQSENIIRKAAARELNINKVFNELTDAQMRDLGIIFSINPNKPTNDDLMNFFRDGLFKIEQFNKDPNNLIDPNEMMDEDYAKIKNFSISSNASFGGQKIELSDIKLLEKFSNLEELTLRDISFPDKEIPKWMKILSKSGIFDLSNRFNIDLTPIKKLTKLQKLNLSLSQISDIEPIKGLTNLQELRLSYTKVSSIEPLTKLSNLQYLDLWETQISNLEPLSGMKKLQELMLTSTKVSNLEPLRGLVNLKILLLMGTQVDNLEPIKDCKNLVCFRFDVTKVSDIEPLRGLNNLQQLYIIETQVSDLQPLMGLVNLQTLYIRDCTNITDEQVEDLQKALPNLKITR